MSDLVSYVVTGGAQGVGRAIAERLARDGQVVVVDVADQLGWVHERVRPVGGDAGDTNVAAAAAREAESAGPLTVGVNNAAILRDAALDTAVACSRRSPVSSNGAVLAVDGGRSVNGSDPEAV